MAALALAAPLVGVGCTQTDEGDLEAFCTQLEVLAGPGASLDDIDPSSADDVGRTVAQFEQLVDAAPSEIRRSVETIMGALENLHDAVSPSAPSESSPRTVAEVDDAGGAAESSETTPETDPEASPPGSGAGGPEERRQAAADLTAASESTVEAGNEIVAFAGEACGLLLS